MLIGGELEREIRREKEKILRFREKERKKKDDKIMGIFERKSNKTGYREIEIQHESEFRVEFFHLSFKSSWEHLQ